ncbi:MAG: hypothetical protein O3A50_09885 [Planctomycetota bacterium]|nr:hypothetical protein [Planctomycetota bacterium]
MAFLASTTSRFGLLLLAGLSLSISSFAQEKQNRPDAFRQLEEILPTANETRTGSGAPGHAYWQQKVDYQIDVHLDEVDRRITGKEHITYHNHSPDTLTYLWVQLENNRFLASSAGNLTAGAPDLSKGMSFNALHNRLVHTNFDGSFHITEVTQREQPLLLGKSAVNKCRYLCIASQAFDLKIQVSGQLQRPPRPNFTIIAEQGNLSTLQVPVPPKPNRPEALWSLKQVGHSTNPMGVELLRHKAFLIHSRLS